MISTTIFSEKSLQTEEVKRLNDPLLYCKWFSDQRNYR